MVMTMLLITTMTMTMEMSVVEVVLPLPRFVHALGSLLAAATQIMPILTTPLSSRWSLVQRPRRCLRRVYGSTREVELLRPLPRSHPRLRDLPCLRSNGGGGVVIRGRLLVMTRLM